MFQPARSLSARKTPLKSYQSQNLNRRRFGLLTGSALTTAFATNAPAQIPTKRPAPSDRIRIGVIGLGSRGFNLLGDLLKQKDVDVTVVCDVDRLHYRDQVWGKGAPMGRDAAQSLVEKSGRPKPETQVDFREVCGRNDIDAIVIATPDHWHALCTLTALRNGKDVYCEKPVTHWFHEGLAVCREVRERQAVFQTGSQQRSEDVFRRSVELVRNGVLGKIQRVEVGLPPGYETVQGDIKVARPRDDLDYDLWCGPAPMLPYMPARHHRWWRGHRAFGGGVLMDWIGHHNDIAHWALEMDESGPSVVEAMNWQFPSTELYNTPWHFTIRCEYANGVTSTISDSNTLGTKLYGELGWLHVTRGKLTTSDPRWAQTDFDPGDWRLPESPGHIRNFIDCIRSRTTCVASAEVGHRSITPGHLGYVSQTVGRPLRWDAAKQTILDDPEADQLLRSGTYRAPWNLA
jgi:predicted dehydrogenase